MLTCIRFITLVLTLVVSGNLYGVDKIDDIRVVIDVSGSMKKTDPANLRVVAMKLLNGIIPSGAKAGVWTFGKYVNMTVKWGTVDNKWRKLADIGAEEIHSNAALTNIESALARSTKGWDKPDPGTRRSLILLTDGKVDVSKDDAKNAKSRQNILDKSVQRLQQSRVNIQAIALSKNADVVLLKRLALETSGSFEIAEKAEDLQRIFFKMFERATEPDTISLNGNQFKIDSSIKKLTLLIFRKSGSPTTRVYPPEGTSFSEKRPGNAIWRSDDAYDLITIKNPQQGLWHIEADVDPDNRLMVVTGLKLEVADIPPYITPVQPININAALFNKGSQIKKNSFLRFVDFELIHTSAEGIETKTPLTHSKEREKKGQYQHGFVNGLEEGKHSILVTVDSRTFNRSKRIDIDVQWPAKVSIQPTESPGIYDLSIQAREEYLKPESLKPTVSLQSPDALNNPLELVATDNIWRARIDTNQDGLYQARISIEAQTQAGDIMTLDLGNFSMIGVYKAAAKTEMSDQAEAMDKQAKTTKESEVGVEDDEDDGPDWVATSIIIGVANLALILIAVGVYFLIRRKSASAAFSVE